MMRKQFFAGRKSMALACGALLLAFSAAAVFAYTTVQISLGTSQPATAVWPTLPVQWLLNTYTPAGNVSTSGCTLDTSSCIQQSLANGFAGWTSATVKIQGTPQSLTDLRVSYSGTSTAQTPDATDCQNVVGFSDSASDFSTGTIAFTEIAYVTAGNLSSGPPYGYSTCGNVSSDSPAILVDADIEFNPGYSFYTDTVSSSSAFDLQAVATHEEGHLLGMGHSGLAHTVMFPFGDTTATGERVELATDDSLGISSLYPCTNPGSGPSCTAKFSTSTGTISGQVSLNSSGTFGAHVVAIDTSTGDVVTDGLTAPDGSYTLVGVPPGNYHILALPLAADQYSGILLLGDFSGWACGYGDANCNNVPLNPTNFTGRFH